MEILLDRRSLISLAEHSTIVRTAEERGGRRSHQGRVFEILSGAMSGI